jgi:hypothetical protein
LRPFEVIPQIKLASVSAILKKQTSPIISIDHGFGYELQKRCFLPLLMAHVEWDILRHPHIHSLPIRISGSSLYQVYLPAVHLGPPPKANSFDCKIEPQTNKRKSEHTRTFTLGKLKLEEVPSALHSIRVHVKSTPHLMCQFTRFDMLTDKTPKTRCLPFSSALSVK